MKVQFTDFWGGYDNNDNFWTIMFKKLNIPYEVVPDNSDLLISSCFGSSFLNKKSRKKLYWTGENWYRMNQKLNPMGKSILDMFDMVYSFDYNDYERHYRLPLYLVDCIERSIFNFEFLRKKTKDELYEEFKDRKFCTFVQGNGNCQFRNDYFNSLNKIEKVDSYGSLFNNTGINLDRIGKLEKTKEYKFALSFENSIYDGYVSEKIVDAFKSDIIPIYWGGSNIGSEFNNNSFINVHQHGLEKSLKLVEDLNKDFGLYWSYYNSPIISDEQGKFEDRILKFEDNFKNFIGSI